MPIACTTTLHIRHPLTDITLNAGIGPDGPVVLSTAFGIHGRARKAGEPALAGAASGWAAQIAAYLRGETRDLSSIPLNMTGITPFRRAVLEAARRIPRGTTVSYAQLAAMAGSPGAARAAASAMRNNRFPLIVPCHRVVRTGGGIGGFMGRTSGSAITLKRRLLALESARGA
jgi:methylated-DNA-[protein]-cysteine S-methyltransferase